MSIHTYKWEPILHCVIWNNKMFETEWTLLVFRECVHNKSNQNWKEKNKVSQHETTGSHCSEYCDMTTEGRNNLTMNLPLLDIGSLTHVSAATNAKLTHVSIRWIPRNQLNTKSVSMWTKIQQRFLCQWTSNKPSPWLPGLYAFKKPCRDEHSRRD
jgi:hypothetical protein